MLWAKLRQFPFLFCWRYIEENRWSCVISVTIFCNTWTFFGVAQLFFSYHSFLPINLVSIGYEEFSLSNCFEWTRNLKKNWKIRISFHANVADEFPRLPNLIVPWKERVFTSGVLFNGIIIREVGEIDFPPCHWINDVFFFPGFFQILFVLFLFIYFKILCDGVVKYLLKMKVFDISCWSRIFEIDDRI